MPAYGLVADPTQIRNQVKDLAAAVPASGRDLLLQQLDALTSAPRQGLGIGVAIAVVAALWSASGGAGYLLTAVNLAYDEDETRGFVRRKLLAMGMTLGAVPSASETPSRPTPSRSSFGLHRRACGRFGYRLWRE